MLRIIPGPRGRRLTVDDVLSVLSCLAVESSQEKNSKTFSYLAGQLDALRALGLIAVIDVTGEEGDDNELDDPVRKGG